MALIRDVFVGGPAANVIARLMIVIGVTPIMAPAVGGLFLDHTSWRGLFLVLAGFGAILLLVAGRAIPETHPRGRRRSARPMASLRTYRMLLADRTFVALVLVAGLMLSTLFSWIAGSPFVLQGRYGLSPQMYGLVVGANAVATVLFGQLNPLLLRRWQPSQLLAFGVWGAAAAATGLLLAATTGAGGLIGVLAPAAVIAAALGLVLPNAPALALSRHGEAAGTAAAALGATQFGIGAVTAPLVGWLGTDTAAPTAAVIGAATLGAAALMILAVRRDRTVDVIPVPSPGRG
jgi:DHA1 family bicyclomycin/chloramphenicol resistance-like MFS transporter